MLRRASWVLRRGGSILAEAGESEDVIERHQLSDIDLRESMPTDLDNGDRDAVLALLERPAHVAGINGGVELVPNVNVLGVDCWLYDTKRGRRLRIRGVKGVSQVTPQCRSRRSR
ncbi:MAG: hypothetical protein M3R02_04885 [Chloroflexota bacterium]|nr:hypothetical protein [Chloroflexota bacterium]